MTTPSDGSVGMHDPAVIPEPLLSADVDAPTALAGSVASLDDKKRGQFRDVWRRYRRNKLAMFGLTIVGLLALIAILQPLISPYDPLEPNLANTQSPPTGDHWFGTDGLGRDVFSEILYGTKLALSIGLIAMVLSLLVGVSLGALAGYKGKWIDALIMRITDVFLAFPPLIAAIMILHAIGRANLLTVILALSVLAWTTTARLMRGQVLSLRESEYVEAARSIGAPGGRIVMRHILPNAISPVLILAFSGIGVTVVAMASLSYLGVGLPIDIPDWGHLVSEALQLYQVPGLELMWVFPSAAIVITTLGFAFVADGLRDSLDPKLR